MGESLRDVLAEALRHDWWDEDAGVDAILATLAEHRDETLALLGMEQVGWVNGDEMPAKAWSTAFIDSSDGGAIPLYRIKASLIKEEEEA